MRFSRKLLRRTFSIVAMLALAGTTGFVWQPALPASSGTLKVKGPTASIEIVRDHDGAPHIRAKTENDAQFGLGYVHAQDRLWQMEYQRRLGNGRLAEILGEPGLLTDRLFRTIGLHRTATTAWAKLSPKERKPVETYVAGVNAYLTRPNRQLPPEFGILGVEPEPWRPEDVLVWSKVVAWGLSGNWDHELLRAQLTPKLGPEKTAQLMPAYTKDGPVILSQGLGVRDQGLGVGVLRASESLTPDPHPLAPNPRALADLLALHDMIAERTGLGAEGFGSNNWVLSGARTTTGKPLLANDPHLSGQTPSIWYLAHLNGGAVDVIGGTFPGLPGVLVGHNGHIAWGVTTINVDSQDLYIERINERNEAQYKGAWEPLAIVPETIKIKDKPDLNLTVRTSRHGPLISDVVNPAGQPLALRWTGNDAEDAGLLATLAVNRARNWREFTAAFRTHRGPDQNYVYADHQGNIGYIAPATIPMRARGDGRLPIPGWTGEHEWTGYVPFAELPRLYNPPRGYIVTANNKVAGDDYPHLIGTNFAVPYRAARIVEMIEAKTRHSADDMAAMQADVLAVHARELLPLLLQTQPADERGKQALALLRGWDARATGDSAATAIFEAWYIRIAQRLFADEIGDLWPAYGRNIYMVGMALEAALQENQAWCDDVRTPQAESCGDTLAAALSDGLNDMAKAQGTDDVTAWRWDRPHRAQFPHTPFDADPALKPAFSRTIPNSGDRYTVNVASSFRRWDDYDQYHAASYRQIVDFRNIDASRFITAPGQSGDPDSPHYDDLLERWQRVEYLPMRYDRKVVEGAAPERLLLEP